jgi:2-phosphosulfolactate phosphatase
VLPSPNGSALAFAAAEAGATQVMVGSLRNAGAIGRSIATAEPGTVAVIAAGERWRGSTGPLRPALEDLLGAGAILSAIDRGATTAVPAASVAPNSASPEASMAMAGFNDARPELAKRLRTCGSGRELIDRGFSLDVELAAALDDSTVVPTLVGQELVDGAR